MGIKYPYLNTLNVVSKFGADKWRSRVGGIHMQPHVELLAHRAYFVETIKTAATSGAQCRNNLK